MLLSEVRSSIRRKLDDQDYDGPTIDEAIGFFIDQLYNDSNIRRMEKSTAPILSQGATSIDLPVDFNKLISFSVVLPTNYNIDDSFVNYQDFTKLFSNYATVQPQPVSRWTIFGTTVRFSAPADTNYTFAFDYLRKPVRAIVDTDVIDIPDNYKELVVLGGTQRIMKINEDYDEGAFEANDLAAMVTSFIRNEGRGSGKTRPTIIRNNRGFRGRREF